MSTKVRPHTIALASLLLLVGLGTAGGATADTTSTNPDRPTAGNQVIPNPGAIEVGPDSWLVATTGKWTGTHRTFIGQPSGAGTWSPVSRTLLNHKPAWASVKAYWAPSIVRRADGHYVVFYSAEVKDTKERRCIGTGVSTGTDISPSGIPAAQDFIFTAVRKPLVCWNGAGADNPSADPRFKDARYKIIDPTPAVLDTDGKNGPELYLTYKTSSRVADGRKHSTLRMVRLDPNAPQRKVFGTTTSHQLNTWTNVSIEENPVMVQSGNRFILFSSRGHFDGNCASGAYPYQTVYRVSTNPWKWSTAPRNLHFPAKSNSCGSGNAHIAQLSNGDWRIFFNGKYRSPFRAPAAGNLKGWRKIPFGMYIGRLKFGSTGRPTVSFVYK